MGSLLGILVDICMLRKGPQHLPASTALTALAVAASVLMGIWVEVVIGAQEHRLARPLMSTLASLVFVLALLNLRGVPARFRQTFTAFAGAGALLTLLFVPILWSIDPSSEPRSLNPIAYLAFWCLTVWSFVIDAHIFRHALSVSFTVGFLFATLAFALITALRYLLFMA